MKTAFQTPARLSLELELEDGFKAWLTPGAE